MGTSDHRGALPDAGAARPRRRGLGITAAGAGIEALLARAAAAAPRAGTLKDIEHVVILIQENRSFDHYFGTLRGSAGSTTSVTASVFFQTAGRRQTIHPFHLEWTACADLTHDWGPQHQSWNSGKMDRFLRARTRRPTSLRRGAGVETMGYYTARTSPFYYALADAFTICDGYHCSVIGPTDPNRLYSMSGTIDPAGKHGGPLVETLTATRAQYTGKFTWTTMPERLRPRG